MARPTIAARLFSASLLYDRVQVALGEHLDILYGTWAEFHFDRADESLHVWGISHVLDWGDLARLGFEKVVQHVHPRAQEGGCACLVLPVLAS